MATENDERGDTTGEDSPPAGDEGGDAGTPQGEEQDTFPREYVEQLRAEAAEHRNRAKRAEDAEARLRALAVADAVRGILTSPDDLTWSDEFADEHGWPDAEKIKAAAEALVDRKPYLGRPHPGIGQGEHDEHADDSFSIMAVLRGEG